MCVNVWKKPIFRRLKAGCAQQTWPSNDFSSARLSIGCIFTDVNWHPGKILTNWERTGQHQRHGPLLRTLVNTRRQWACTQPLHRIDLNAVVSTYLSVTWFVSYRPSSWWKIEIQLISSVAGSSRILSVNISVFKNLEALSNADLKKKKKPQKAWGTPSEFVISFRRLWFYRK